MVNNDYIKLLLEKIKHVISLFKEFSIFFELSNLIDNELFYLINPLNSASIIYFHFKKVYLYINRFKNQMLLLTY